MLAQKYGAHPPDRFWVGRSAGSLPSPASAAGRVLLAHGWLESETCRRASLVRGGYLLQAKSNLRHRKDLGRWSVFFFFFVFVFVFFPSLSFLMGYTERRGGIFFFFFRSTMGFDPLHQGFAQSLIGFTGQPRSRRPKWLPSYWEWTSAPTACHSTLERRWEGGHAARGGMEKRGKAAF
ncbi:hypothetical protein GQ53DRAFT_23612 [Thozetella sp. PMI_491]|nr:hypothetical protein GQ53DRAFT_23612 [Thozetella sp. PMI_491]